MGALGSRRSSGLWLARFTCVLVTFLLDSGVGQAQNTAESLLPSAPGRDNIALQVTMDPAFMLGLGYVRSFDLDASRARKLAAFVDLEALLDLSSWSLTTGASARLFDRSGFDVLGTVSLDLALAQNEVHSAVSYGYRVSVFPGYYRPKWYAAAEMGLRGNLAATLWHGDEYLAEMPDARDGTYWTGATVLYVGASAGFRAFEHYFFGVRAAYRLPTTFESYGPWIQPMTAGVEFGGTFDLF